jgi:hypothetical protein
VHERFVGSRDDVLFCFLIASGFGFAQDYSVVSEKWIRVGVGGKLLGSARDRNVI